MAIDISTLDDVSKAQLVEARWTSSSELWDKVNSIYKSNTAVYENRSSWLGFLPERRKKYQVQANRVFVNMEAVINSLIANPPGINILPAHEGLPAQDFARKLESYFRKKYTDLNLKEIVRMALRNLYFARLLVIKPFWNPLINDFDFRAIDPRNIRVGKYARKEPDAEFVIEEIEDNLCAVIERFPKKKDELMKKYGIPDEERLYILNPDVKYKEAWINNYVIFKLENIILDTIKNPYWDWEGILISEQEEEQLKTLEGDQRRQFLQGIKLDQEKRKATIQPPQAPEAPEKGLIGKAIDGVKSLFQPAPEGEQVPNPNEIAGTEGAQSPTPQYKSYYYNYFDNPRKPYIFATIFNNENTPIGRTDMITLSAELQRGIDKRKMDIDENCEFINGILKVDASVMGKSDAQRIRFETKGIIWGKGVKDGVTREVGQGLSDMVFKDMLDSRSEIDNIMAASSAFRGEREGQETKAGRLALIQQSFLRLNELIQVVDYAAHEIFSWSMQLAKTRYTEYHTAELADKEGEREAIELIQDDIQVGNKVTIIAGKSLPVDDEWKFEQAQLDVEKGYISPPDYLQIAKYDNSKELSKNAVTYKINPSVSVGITPEEMQTLSPQKTEEKPPNVSVNYADLPPDAQGQLLEKIGIKADPHILVAEKIAEHQKTQNDFNLKKQGQEHGQVIAEKTVETKAQPKGKK